MPDLDMLDPCELSEILINTIIEKKRGNYAFGYLDNENNFIVCYVGRSDTDLQREIKQQMKTDRAKGCTHFMYSYASSKKEAFEKECRNYHDFGESDHLHNEYHPDKPDRTDYKCPVKGCEYNN